MIEYIFIEYMYLAIEYAYTCPVDRTGEQHLGHLGLEAAPSPHEGSIVPEAAARALAPGLGSSIYQAPGGRRGGGWHD